ncbi:MAG: amino acid permease [Thermoleophilia bacterium]|nr:amino acid permease [Thermoleophilia bacterium]
MALLTIITTLTGFWLASARILYSMGKARILPAWFDRLNKNSTPGNASVVILAICIFFIVASGTNWLAALLALMATGLGVAYTGSSLAFLQLRRKYPQWARPWKLPVGNLLGALAVLASLAILYFSAKYLDTLMWKVFAAYVAIGAVIWLVMIFEARRNPENYAVRAQQGVVEGAE